MAGGAGDRGVFLEEEALSLRNGDNYQDLTGFLTFASSHQSWNRESGQSDDIG